MINRFVDRLLKRKWSKQDIQKYIGCYQDSWMLYSGDELIRKNAASGGTITGLLVYLLEQGQIDGALVCTSYVESNELKTRYIIATNRQELVCSQGSKYIDTDFAHEAVPLIKNFQGRLALVLLPCDTSLVSRLSQHNLQLLEKIKLIITVFCGHVSDPELTRLVIQKIKPAGVSLKDFRYRTGHWRGRLHATFEDGTHSDRPFSAFSDYQNLFFYCTRKCLNCNDHTGYKSDISVGDMWLMSMKDNPIKHNVAIIRSERASQILFHTMESDVLIGRRIPIEVVCDAQSRSLPLHYNVTARKRAGRWFGVKLSDQVAERVRLIDFWVACIIMANYRFSHSPIGQRLIPRIPKNLLKIYLYFLKALEVL